MKLRTLTFFAVAALAGCDPSGSTVTSPLAANIRLANLVTDVTALDLHADGRAIVSSLGFGQVSTFRSLAIEDTILVLSRHSDAAEVATDSVVLVNGRAYSYYVVGAFADARPRLLTDDTTFAASGHIKLRIVNGVGTHAGTGLDFYASLPSDSLAAITPQVPTLAFGAASPYIPTDTSFRRFRLALDGQTTAIFDTTLTTPIADSSVVTVVVSDKQGGGSPFRFLLTVDRAP